MNIPSQYPLPPPAGAQGAASYQLLQRPVSESPQQSDARRQADDAAAEERTRFQSTAQQEAEAKEERSQEDLEKLAEEASKTLKFLQVNRHFEVHEDSGRTVIKLYDSNSGEFIKQVPSESSLERILSMQQFLGTTYDQTI